VTCLDTFQALHEHLLAAPPARGGATRALGRR